jgi:putative transposase
VKTWSVPIKRVEIRQTTLLRKWFGVARKYYNEAVDLMNRKVLPTCSFADVRPAVKDRLDHISYCSAVPDKIRQGAIEDACKAVSNAKMACLADPKHKYHNVRFRKKTACSQSIYLIKTAVRQDAEDIVVYPRLGLGRLRTGILPIGPACSHRLVMKHRRHFAVHVSVPIEDRRTENQGRRFPIVALDPGARKFHAYYSPERCGLLGANLKRKMYPLFATHDQLRSDTAVIRNKIRTATDRKQKRWLRSTANRMHKHANQILVRCRHLADELHRKTALFLCRNYENVFIPIFETGKMQMSGLAHSTKRMMNWLSHYRFRQFLIHKAKEYLHGVRSVFDSWMQRVWSFGCQIIQGNVDV